MVLSATIYSRKNIRKSSRTYWRYCFSVRLISSCLSVETVNVGQQAVPFVSGVETSVFSIVSLSPFAFLLSIQRLTACLITCLSSFIFVCFYTKIRHGRKRIGYFCRFQVFLVPMFFLSVIFRRRKAGRERGFRIRYGVVLLFPKEANPIKMPHLFISYCNSLIVNLL